MRRREFITLLGGAAAPWPLAARAQQPAMPVIGFLGSTSPELFPEQFRAFHEGLREVGYVEGRDLAIEYRWAEGRYDRLPALAADLVQRGVAVIVAGGLPAALAAKAATSTIPIVFTTGVDPVEAELVTSLQRPSGNLTGASNLNAELGAKRLQLLHELLPTAAFIGALVNPTNPRAASLTSELQALAQSMGLQFHVFHARAEHEFEPAFITLGRARTGALLITTDAFFASRSAQLGKLAFEHAVATIYQSRAFTAAGGLISYGDPIGATYRQAGVYTSRIIKGAHPADLPVVQTTKVELIINLQTAKALGISVPLYLLARADEVIE